jgi:hypothetical protein
LGEGAGGGDPPTLLGIDPASARGLQRCWRGGEKRRGLEEVSPTLLGMGPANADKNQPPRGTREKGDG